MKVIEDESFEAYVAALENEDAAERVKSIRDRVLTPGGRARVRLFESVGGGRPHPRLHIEFPAAEDPSPPSGLVTAPEDEVETAAQVATWLRESLDKHSGTLSAEDLDVANAPKGSERYWRQSIRVQRTAAFFEDVRAMAAGWSVDDADALASVIRVIEDEAYATLIEFDDANTGTYHSYGHDKPFVHYLEALLKSLPEEGSEAMALLSSGAATSIRRQRKQLTAHLDHLMRHKYAYEVIKETDIERTVGGMMIDRKTRNIVSEVPQEDTLTPEFERLRIDPGSQHEHAGDWVFRDREGKIYLEDGTPVTVDAADIRSAPVDRSQITFQRAVGDARLREGMRLDWDGNGYVQPGRIDWVSWAGHCDIKAVQEQLGITLTESPPPSVEEYRADTGGTQVYSRDLLLEMLTSVMELGSMYRRLDGTGRQIKGVHLFGGSRNDSRPDRIQFAGKVQGRGFRWPLSGRKDTFVVKGITWADGSKAEMGTVFFRRIPDLRTTTFEPNPRFLKTVEGDYNLIDVSGAKLDVKVWVDEIDPSTGYLKPTHEDATLDLSPGATGPDDGMFFLGTHVDNAAQRRLYRVYWDPSDQAIVAKMFQYRKEGDRWVAKPLSGEDVRLPMAQGPTVTLSREMKRDNPDQFQALLAIALREAKNICADTDKNSAVWNGVVTRLEAKKVASNEDARTEHWKVDIKARFGSARLEYLVRRDARGEPLEYCPAQDDAHADDWPDFLWHDIPDVGSKAFSQGEWVVNETMVDRGIVTVDSDDSVAANAYVHDDHIKNTFELLYCGLADVRYTIVHDNKRYGFTDRAAWEAAVKKLGALRAAIRYEA